MPGWKNEATVMLSSTLFLPIGFILDFLNFRMEATALESQYVAVSPALLVGFPTPFGLPNSLRWETRLPFSCKDAMHSLLPHRGTGTAAPSRTGLTTCYPAGYTILHGWK